MSEIARLQEWYARQCDGSWEEDYGVTISTLDNPGWSLKVDLRNTNLERREMIDIKVDRSEDDWIVARRSGEVFEAFGGPNNLKEMLRTFLKWAEEAAGARGGSYKGFSKAE
jgi:hypothetical protein